MRAAGRLVRAWRKRLRCVCSSTLFGRLTKVADPLRPIPTCSWQSIDLLGALFAPSDPSPVSRHADKLFARIRGVVKDGFADPDFGPREVAAVAGSRCVTCKSYLLRTARPVVNSYIRFVWIMPRAFCIAARHWEQASHLARSPTPVAFATIPISPANFASGSVTRRAPQRGTRSRWRRHSARRYR
jgi:hypothetical protein